MFEQSSHVHDAASSALFPNGECQFGWGTGPRVQGCIENTKGTWTFQRPRDLHGRPGGVRGKLTVDQAEWSSDPLMHHHIGRRTHPDSRIKNMEAVVGLGVEPVQRGCGLHTDRRALRQSEIQRGESGAGVGPVNRIDPALDAHELTTIDKCA